MSHPGTPALIFDLDGTLVDSIPGLLASLNAVLAPDLPYTAAEVRPMIGDGVAALVQRALAARGRAEDPALLAAYTTYYTARAGQDDALFPDVAQTLGELRGRWRMAVCTNKPEAAAVALLDRLGLGGLFAAVGGGDSFPFRKPDPRHVLQTLSAAGGGQAVMVGDHANDVRAAAGAGLPCIFAAWGYGAPDMAGSAAVAGRFAEIPALARRLLDQRGAADDR